MSEKNVVSIWFGNFETEERFNEFIKERYDDEGDMHSEFADAFQIGFIDNQFQEMLYDKDLDRVKLEPASYSESFLDSIDVDYSKYNSVVFLYDFEYEGTVNKTDEQIDFIGTFLYEK
jgi:hypothetical protein